MRKRFELSNEDLQRLYDAAKPIPCVAIQCGMPPSQQERANEVWCSIGKSMGFDYMTVQPTGEGDKYFTAEEL